MVLGLAQLWRPTRRAPGGIRDSTQERDFGRTRRVVLKLRSRGPGRLVGEERIAAYVESTGLFLAGCAAEGIDSGTDGDVGEARVLKYFLPARTGQPTGYSSGPQVDVLQRFGGAGLPLATSAN